MTDDLSGESRMRTNPQPGTAEWASVTMIVCLAAWLRFRGFDTLAVEHFDEGVYASNYWFAAQDGFQYPNRHLYAPPLLPALIEFLFQQAGPSNAAAMLVSLVLGTLTVPLVWWVGRRWFGAIAGMTAAYFCAASDLHILLSRACLTDVMLTFWLILSIWQMWEALAHQRTMAAVAAGITTALAWWTKYNGWLPLAVSLGGLSLWFLWTRSQGDRSEAAVRGWRWLVATTIAVALWVPCVWSLQAEGGYAAVMANHRSYIVGVGGAAGAMLEHLRDEAALQTWVSVGTGACLFLLMSLAVATRFTWNTRRGVSTLAFGMVASIAGLYVLPLALWGLGCQGLFSELGHSSSSGRGHLLPAQRPRQLAGCFLAVWLVGLFVLTSMYTPYPRLWLPCSSGGWLAAGLAVSQVIHFTWNQTAMPTARLREGLVVLALVVMAGLLSLVPPSTGIQPRTAMVDLCDRIRNTVFSDLKGRVNERDGYIVYVHGEPALFFQLRLAGSDLVRPVQNLGFAAPGAPRQALPTYVVIGPHARLVPDFESELQRALPRLQRVGVIEESVSLLVSLDAWGRFEPRQEFEVYRCR